MELRHLRYFVAVAEEGSVTRAAERLGIQQPPLGLQIRALEDELGVQLFDRQPKRLSLNAAGAVFLDRARQVLSVTEEAVEHVRRFDRGERGRLTVGFTSSASLHHLTPHLMRAFRQAYPLVQLEVEESETYGLILALEQRRIDAAFLHIGTEGFAGLNSTVLAQEDMVVAIPSDHPLAQGPALPIELSMLSGQDLVVYRRPDGPGMFDGIMRAFAAAGVTPRVTDVVHRLIAAINLVAGGRGLTLVPGSIQVLHRQAVTYRSLAPGALPPLPLYLAYRRDEELALVRNFIAVTGQAAVRTTT